MKTLVYLPKAVKALRRLPADLAARIRDKIEQYAADPASQANNITRLQGRSGFRLRVGDWRVLFDEDGTVITVFKVGPRGGVYD